MFVPLEIYIYIYNLLLTIEIKNKCVTTYVCSGKIKRKYQEYFSLNILVIFQCVNPLNIYWSTNYYINLRQIVFNIRSCLRYYPFSKHVSIDDNKKYFKTNGSKVSFSIYKNEIMIVFVCQPKHKCSPPPSHYIKITYYAREAASFIHQ